MELKIQDPKNMEKSISEIIDRILEIGGEKIGFISLYGSAAKGKMTALSDIDIAVFFDGDKQDRFAFRVKILGRCSNIFDIQTFQDLPLYIQNDILSNGRVIYSRDFEQTFNIFMNTIRQFGDFKPRLDIYYAGLGEMKG